MTIIGVLIGNALWLYLMVLFVRMVISWIQVASPRWTPRGLLLVLLEFVYTLTDPPLRLVRRIIPSPQVMGVRLDLGFMVLWLAIVILMQVNTVIFLRG